MVVKTESKAAQSMILFYGEGRLGNQIFQYQALNSIARSGETIVAIGLEDLQNTFELHGARLIVLGKRLFTRRVFKFFIAPLLIYPFAKLLHLFNYAGESSEGAPPHRGSSGLLKLQRGLFSGLTFVHGGYYQNPSLWHSMSSTRNLKLTATLYRQVQRYMDENVDAHCIPIFVHIRRGDYLQYSTYGLNNLALTETYYRNAITAMREQVPNAFFVFVTDDTTWVIKQFNDIADKCIASNNARFDFALMTVCRGGILSNSTYSLCAALMIENPRILIGPQYWFGFRVNEWYPPRIQVTHESMRYIPVPHSAA